MPSSYDAPIALDKKVSAERLLDHIITAFYQLDGPPEFAAALGKDIFTFPFNPRSDYEGNTPAVQYILAGHCCKETGGYEKAMEMYAKAYGPEHTSTAAAYNDIAIEYRDMGN